MIAHRLAGFFSGFFGLEKSSRARTMCCSDWPE
jgi:hypothetical protein